MHKKANTGRAIRCCTCSLLFCRLVIVLTVAFPLAGQEPRPKSLHNLWSQQTADDLSQLDTLMRTRYIYGVYDGHPGYPGYFSILEQAEKRGRSEAAQARTPLDYQFVIRHFLASFDDPHISVEFATMPSSYEWPGFLLVYRDHRYQVTASELPEIADGSIVEGCDGGMNGDLIERVAETSRGGAYDESEKAWYAVAAMGYTRTSYQSLPKVCRIGGKDVELHWRDISPGALRAKQTALRPEYDDGFSVEPFDEGIGAWVRLPSFEAEGAQAIAFHRVIAAAPSLRDKKIIVLDLRGNGGGPYQWFMGFLRSLYGETFTNYYARERLKVQGVYLDLGQSHINSDSSNTSGKEEMKAPSDPVLEATEAHFTTFSGRYGQLLERSERVLADLRETPAGPEPQNLVQGAVIVLTDNGSASAVNSFLDEVLHFPNVTQVGTEPLPDRRSGSPMPYVLASGNGTVYLPYMTRDYRTRGDNQEYIPAHEYGGDIRNTQDVMKWIESLMPELPPFGSSHP